MRPYALILLIISLVHVDAARADVLADRRSLDERYRQQLDELAKWCDAQSLTTEATRVRGWLRPSDTWTIAVPIIPATSELVLPPDASEVQRDFLSRFQKLRDAQADSLFSLAKQAAKEHRVTFAYELVTDTVRENPDHEAARRILGNKRHDGAWQTQYEIDKAQAKQVWHDRFGWLPRDRIARYEKGERFNRGAWVSADEDARRNADMKRPWEVVTEHYMVKTNHSLEEGVRLASRLERLHRVWQQVFVLYWASENEVAGWLNGATPKRRPPQRHQVVYFRNRDEYNAALVKDQPNIAISTGYYEPRSRTAYFFAGTEDDTNLYHEATHQLFSEVRAARTPFGVEANFWIVEGVACYMESLVERDGYCLLGGTNAVRLRDAEFRLRNDGFYLPLAELVTYGMDRLQQDPRLGTLYSESSGLTHFLVHASGGRYRDVLVDYLIAVYSAHDRASTLSELSRKSYVELDREYRTFIEAITR